MKISVTLLNGSKVEYSSYLVSVLIGRSEAAQFRILDPGLSRQHALIENDAGAFFVTDLGSSNGVYIDGQRIAIGQKKSFSNYQTLSLGPLECLVSENNISNNKPVVPSGPIPVKQLTSDLKGDTRTSIMIDRKEFKLALKKQKRNQSSLTLTVIIIIFVAGVYYFKHSDKLRNEKTQKKSHSTPVLIKVNQPILTPVVVVQDKFLEQNVYAERYEKRTCLGYEEICSELLLEEKNSEGVMEKEGQYLVYMYSTKVKNQIFTSFDNDPTKEDIVSLYTILKSNLLNLLASNKMSQIHLILINQENKLYRVYRFNKDHLGKSRIELLNEIRSAIKTKNSETFWIKAHQKIPFIDLT